MALMGDTAVCAGGPAGVIFYNIAAATHPTLTGRLRLNPREYKGIE